MEIHRDETNGDILLFFLKEEIKVVLSILKAIYSVSNLQFIKDEIEDIERELRPRLTMISHYHFCHNCSCEIDDRVGDNFIHYVSDTTDKWFHRCCPPLKEGRPE